MTGAAGERLTAGDDLSAARWQVLGAIALEGRPLTVPQIARRMGLARQSVHGTVEKLAAAGLVELVANTDHQRSRLVRLTAAGEQRYARVSARQNEWVDALAAGLDRRELDTAGRVLDELCTRLETR